MKGVAGVFAYSKTKGAFAGVSLEGSVLIERRDANQKMYNGRITARQLLEGAIRPPPAADPLMNVLNTRVFSGIHAGGGDSMYNDVPVYDDNRDNVVWEGRSGDAYGAGVRNNRSSTIGSRNGDEYEYRDQPRRANTWQDDVYDQGFGSPQRSYSSRADPNATFDSINGRSRSSTLNNDSSFGDSKPARPTAPKPIFRQKTGLGDLKSDQAVALFTFEGEQEGDLSFKKNDVITIVKRTENKSDWWTGRSVDGRVGIFPSNYVETPN
jgi:SH3 domain-containing YSC84-like protein 1